VPFLRVTRDQRGYENTFLLHVAHPGESPRILYWYRSAPGVRVGRPALDEDTIRAIEAQHPEIDFDWPYLLEASTIITPDVERRPERPRRKAVRAQEENGSPPETDTAVAPPVPEPIESEETVAARPASEAEPRAQQPGLLEELVGREIATRLRARYSEIDAAIRAAGFHAVQADWRSRAHALNPDAWVTPDEILRGVQRADALYDELRRDIAKSHDA
jgi:hypothetical protein